MYSNVKGMCELNSWLNKVYSNNKCIFSNVDKKWERQYFRTLCNIINGHWSVCSEILTFTGPTGVAAHSATGQQLFSMWCCRFAEVGKWNLISCGRKQTFVCYSILRECFSVPLLNQENTLNNSYSLTIHQQMEILRTLTHKFKKKK